MKLEHNEQGFNKLLHPEYGALNETEVEISAIVMESSAIGDRPEPGSSYLWIGADHRLNVNEVKELIRYLQTWVDEGRLR